MAPATVVTVGRPPRGDAGRYTARLREAGVAADELQCAVSAVDNGRMLADLGEALRRSLADESARPATSDWAKDK
jgi:hypothetical protein